MRTAAFILVAIALSACASSGPQRGSFVSKGPSYDTDYLHAQCPYGSQQKIVHKDNQTIIEYACTTGRRRARR